MGKSTEKITVKQFMKDFFEGYMDNDLGNLSCQISYRFLLGIFPFLLFLLISLSTLNLDPDLLMNQAEALPESVVQILDVLIKDMTKSSTSFGLMSTTFIVAIYSSSKAFKIVIECVNKIYYGEVRKSLISRYITSLLFMVLFFFLVILPLIFFVFESAIIACIEMFFDLSFLKLSAASSIALFGAMFGYLTLVVMSMYGLSLERDIRLRSNIVGAVFCVLVWWLSSYAFNFYVDNFSSYSAVYGSIGALILFLMWVNLITLVLLLGALINKILYEYRLENKSFLFNHYLHRKEL